VELAKEQGHTVGVTCRFIQDAGGLVFFYGPGEFLESGPNTWTIDPKPKTPDPEFDVEDASANSKLGPELRGSGRQLFTDVDEAVDLVRRAGYVPGESCVHIKSVGGTLYFYGPLEEGEDEEGGEEGEEGMGEGGGGKEDAMEAVHDVDEAGTEVSLMNENPCWQMKIKEPEFDILKEYPNLKLGAELEGSGVEDFTTIRDAVEYVNAAGFIPGNTCRSIQNIAGKLCFYAKGEEREPGDIGPQEEGAEGEEDTEAGDEDRAVAEEDGAASEENAVAAEEGGADEEDEEEDEDEEAELDIEAVEEEEQENDVDGAPVKSGLECWRLDPKLPEQAAGGEEEIVEEGETEQENNEEEFKPPYVLVPAPGATVGAHCKDASGLAEFTTIEEAVDLVFAGGYIPGETCRYIQKKDGKMYCYEEGDENGEASEDCWRIDLKAEEEDVTVQEGEGGLTAEEEAELAMLEEEEAAEAKAIAAIEAIEAEEIAAIEEAEAETKKKGQNKWAEQRAAAQAKLRAALQAETEVRVKEKGIQGWKNIKGAITTTSGIIKEAQKAEVAQQVKLRKVFCWQQAEFSIEAEELPAPQKKAYQEQRKKETASMIPAVSLQAYNAAEKGEIKVVKEVIPRFTSLLNPDGDETSGPQSATEYTYGRSGSTLLHVACLNKQLDMVR